MQPSIQLLNSKINAQLQLLDSKLYQPDLARIHRSFSLSRMPNTCRTTQQNILNHSCMSLQQSKVYSVGRTSFHHQPGSVSIPVRQFLSTRRLIIPVQRSPMVKFVRVVPRFINDLLDPRRSSTQRSPQPLITPQIIGYLPQASGQSLPILEILKRKKQPFHTLQNASEINPRQNISKDDIFIDGQSPSPIRVINDLKQPTVESIAETRIKPLVENPPVRQIIDAPFRFMDFRNEDRHFQMRENHQLQQMKDEMKEYSKSRGSPNRTYSPQRQKTSPTRKESQERRTTPYERKITPQKPTMPMFTKEDIPTIEVDRPLQQIKEVKETRQYEKKISNILSPKRKNISNLPQSKINQLKSTKSQEKSVVTKQKTEMKNNKNPEYFGDPEIKELQERVKLKIREASIGQEKKTKIVYADLRPKKRAAPPSKQSYAAKATRK